MFPAALQIVHHYKNTAVKRAGEPTVIQGELSSPKCFGCSGCALVPRPRRRPDGARPAPRL